MHAQWTLSELKETILALLALTWGIAFLIPGETLSRASRIDLLRFYAGDLTWAFLLIFFSIFLLFSPRHRLLWLRRSAHFFFWIFWIGISLIVIVRSFSNGFTANDALLCSPFIALAFLHAIFYMRLVYVK